MEGGNGVGRLKATKRYAVERGGVEGGGGFGGLILNKRCGDSAVTVEWRR